MHIFSISNLLREETCKKKKYELKPGFWMLSNKIYSKIKLKECENLKKNTTKTVT
jgi:hypothetical protein